MNFFQYSSKFTTFIAYWRYWAATAVIVSGLVAEEAESEAKSVLTINLFIYDTSVKWLTYGIVNTNIQVYLFRSAAVTKANDINRNA